LHIHTKLGRVLALSLIVVCRNVDRGDPGYGSDESAEEGEILQINQWRVASRNGIDRIELAKSIVAEKAVSVSNGDMLGITTLFAVVRGARCLQIEIRAVFDFACLTVRKMATLVIRKGVLRLLIVQEMLACLSTETDIRSRTHTANG
jgi:hypothetical protein